MTTHIYCYHCMRHHPAAEMRSQPGPKGLRWRCLRSLEAARASVAEREAFGRRQTEENRARNRDFSTGMHHLRRQLAQCA